MNKNKRLKELKEKRFMIDMIDTWSEQDKKDYSQLCAEIKVLELEIEKEYLYKEYCSGCERERYCHKECVICDSYAEALEDLEVKYSD